MKRIVIFVLLVIGAFVAYQLLFANYTNRFRLTIEVDTPDGIKSGSSVIQTWFYESGNWGPVEARGVRAEARGEAVFVDLGHARHVIGVLGWSANGQDQDRIYGLTRAALAPGKRVDWKDEYKLKGKGDLPVNYVPTLVTFADINDPKTVRVVPPADFESVFGPGVRFRSASVETTDDPVTRKISEKLPLLTSHADEMRKAYSETSRFVAQYHLFMRDGP